MLILTWQARRAELATSSSDAIRRPGRGSPRCPAGALHDLAREGPPARGATEPPGRCFFRVPPSRYGDREPRTAGLAPERGSQPSPAREDWAEISGGARPRGAAPLRLNPTRPGPSRTKPTAGAGDRRRASGGGAPSRRARGTRASSRARGSVRSFADFALRRAAGRGDHHPGHPA